VPHVLVSHRIAGIRLAEWLAILIGLPLIYLITGLVNRVISPLVAWTGNLIPAVMDDKSVDNVMIENTDDAGFKIRFEGDGVVVSEQ